MRKFFKIFFLVHLVACLFSVAVFFAVGFDFSFILSFVVGYTAVVLDHLLLARFSERFRELALSGRSAGSGLARRLALLFAGFAVVSLFTPLNYFAIILAVAIAGFGVTVLTAILLKRFGAWSMEAS